MDMLMEILLKLLQLPVGKHEGVADTIRYLKAVGKAADFMDGVTDRFMLAMQPDERIPDRLAVPGIRLVTACSGRFSTFERREEHLFFLLEVRDHVSGYFLEDDSDPDHLRMVLTMHGRSMSWRASRSRNC